jgi:tetratricopeptide (TPR) repeat protein
MKLKQIIIILLATVAVSCGSENNKKLEGVWLYPVEGELNVLYFHQSKVNIYTFDSFQEYNYTVNNDIVPYQIDLISPQDSNYSIKGIYEIDGESLKIKLNTQLSLNANRPQSLKGMNVGYFEKSDWTNEKFNDFYQKNINLKIVKINDLTKALNYDSLNVRKLMKRSFLYTETSQYYKASEDLEKVQSHNKNAYPTWQIWDLLARSYARVDEDSISHLYLDSLINRFPNHEEAYYQKGLLLCKNGEIEQGCHLFDQAIQKGAFEPSIRVSKLEFCK